MTPPPANTPWWAWLLGLAIVFAVPATMTYLAQKRTRRDLSEIKDQVKNTHETNLREDLDLKFAELGTALGGVKSDLASVRDDIGGLHSETRDLRKDVTGIRTDAREDRRKQRDTEQSLDDHLKDVPRLLDEVLAKHVADCPLRQQ